MGCGLDCREVDLWRSQRGNHVFTTIGTNSNLHLLLEASAVDVVHLKAWVPYKVILALHRLKVVELYLI